MQRKDVWGAVRAYTNQARKRFLRLLAAEKMLGHLTPYEAERVLDALLNIPEERRLALMEAARDSGGSARALPQWE